MIPDRLIIHIYCTILLKEFQFFRKIFQFSLKFSAANLIFRKVSDPLAEIRNTHHAFHSIPFFIFHSRNAGAEQWRRAGGGTGRLGRDSASDAATDGRF